MHKVYLLRKNAHDEQKMMPIRSNMVNTNVFHYFKWKIAMYVVNFTKNPSIFKIKRDENILWRHLCIYTLITDGLQPIKLLLYKELLHNKI